MSRRRLRFIHSSDWHLESPLGGLAEVPERIKGLLADAPYLAAEKVIAAALAEQADFVVLAGDILDVEFAGPRGVAFLVRQFERLAERHVPVYWAGGRVDRPERWPAAIRLPENVFRFSSRRPDDFLFQAGDQPAARLTGMSRPRGGKIRAADFWPDADGLPTIAVAHGHAERASLEARNISYWALGGKHCRTTVLDARQAASYSGSPQGRGPDETGAFGCTVVDVDEQGRVQTCPIATDVVRWCRRRATVNAATTVATLETMLADQLRELCNAAPDLHQFVSWTINGSGPVVAALRRGPLGAEILDRLRGHVKQETSYTWCVSLDVEPEAAVPPAWSQQDSLLGDFLRSLAQFDGQGETEPADLIGPLAQLAGPSTADKRLVRLGDTDRRRVLQKAAALGAKLLGSEEAKP